MNNSIAVDRNVQTHVSQDRLHAGALLGSAGLMGFGLILFIAANWDALSRFQRFWLAASVIAAGGLLALLRTSLIAPGLLLAFAGTGGMLALIGQTYQTGADVWQLFALWAALALPWAVAARSDAVWTPWALVVMTAVALWYQSFGGLDLDWFIDSDQKAVVRSFLGIPLPVLGTWIMALGVCALMGPQLALDRWLGTRRWAFRLALALTIILVASHANESVLGWRTMRLGTYFLGLTVLGGIAAWLAASRPRDMFLLAATALAIDTTLICGVVRSIWPSVRSSDWGAFLLIGLIAAGIVAASVVVLMRLARNDNNSPPVATTHPPKHVDAVRPWPVVLLSGFGALMAATPFLTALALLLGKTIEKGPGTYVVAFVMLPIAVHFVRQARGLFSEQLAIVGLATGLLLLGWGLFRDLPIGWAGLISGAIALVLALGLGRSWLAALLGAAATAGFALALNALVPGPWYLRGAAAYGLVWSCIALTGVAVAYAMATQRAWLQPLGEFGVAQDSLDATLAGWLAAALAGLAIGSGSTFLVGAHVGGSITGSETAAIHMIMPARLFSGLIAGAACAWLWRELPSLRTALATALMAVAVVLSLAMPALGATILVLALAIITQRRIIGLAAVVAVLWILGAFYYNLSLPLTQKAAILALSGAVLGAAALATGARMPVARLPDARGSVTPSSVLPRALVALGLAMVGSVSADAIRSKETLIRDGAPVFIEMAPVDPRSLMQGDFMALRFQLPDGALHHQPAAGERPRAIGKRDTKGVLRLTRIGDLKTPLADGEMMIELARKSRRWIVVTDAWFFKEGTAKKWEAARFGEFRVLPDGRALLVGLADKDLAAIK